MENALKDFNPRDNDQIIALLTSPPAGGLMMPPIPEIQPVAATPLMTDTQLMPPPPPPSSPVLAEPVLAPMKLKLPAKRKRRNNLPSLPPPSTVENDDQFPKPPPAHESNSGPFQRKKQPCGVTHHFFAMILCVGCRVGLERMICGGGAGGSKDQNFTFCPHCKRCNTEILKFMYP